MASIENTARLIFRWEGGFSNHPLDSGGATMRGVTFNTYKAYCKKKNLPTPTIQQLKKLSTQDALDVLRVLFWEPLKASQINNQSIADLIVDNCWGSGLGYVKIIQRVLGVTPDGVIGPLTLSKINTLPQSQLHKSLKDRRKLYYERVVANNPSQKVFLKGWLNRLNDFTFAP